MKHYKDNNNNIFAVEAGQEGIILDGWVEINGSDIPSVLDAKKTKEEKDKEAEDAEWHQYLKDEKTAKRTAWKLAGKPKYKGN